MNKYLEKIAELSEETQQIINKRRSAIGYGLGGLVAGGLAGAAQFSMGGNSLIANTLPLVGAAAGALYARGHNQALKDENPSIAKHISHAPSPTNHTLAGIILGSAVPGLGNIVGGIAGYKIGKDKLKEYASSYSDKSD